MKKCSRCAKEKPLVEFQRRAKSKDGYAGICKTCKRAYDNAHYASHPNRKGDIRQSREKRRRENQEWVKAFLISHPCIDCGEDNIVVLEFDHREDKARNVASMWYSPLEDIIKEVSKCDVRCANCHRIKTARTLGSWRLAPIT